MSPRKTAVLETFFIEQHPDIVIGTWWLDKNITSTEIFPDHMQVFRNDRNTKGGGVIIAVDKNIPCFERKDLAQPDT